MSELLIVKSISHWIQLGPLTKLSYATQCTYAALFWQSSLRGKYDFCDRKTRKAQARIVRPIYEACIRTIACVTDNMTIEAMWKSLVTDVRNWSNVTVGRARGTIDEETHLKIVTGVVGRAEIVRIASDEAKKHAMEEVADDEGTAAQDTAPAGEAAVALVGTNEETGGAVSIRPKAAATSSGFVDEQKAIAARVGLPVGKMMKLRMDELEHDLMDVCAGVKFGSAKQNRRLDAAAELAMRKMHPRAERIQGGGPSGDKESSGDDEEDESHVFAGMDGTSVLASVRMSEAIGRVAAFASSMANAGFYRQDEECERARRMRRHRRVDRIQGGGDGGEDGEDGNEMNHQSQDDFEPEAEGEVTFQVRFEIQSGATTQRRGAHGFEKPCSINMGKGAHDIEAFCDAVESGRRHFTKDFVRCYLYNFGRMLWDLAGVQHLYGDSRDTITHLAVQNEGQRILEHQDSADISAQLVVSIGDFDGGILEVLVGREWIPVDTRYRPTLVEGRYWHRVTKITRGRRFVIIVFKNTDRNRDEACPHLSSGYLK